MKNTSFLSFGLLLLSTLVGCAAEEGTGTDGLTASPISTTPDAGPTCYGLGAEPPGATSPSPGVVNPASAYCARLGYTLNESSCVFPDGVSCDQWAFYRGECGQARSFCELHGGQVSNKSEDMGSWTASYAVCTLSDGRSCQESVFATSCGCE